MTAETRRIVTAEQLRDDAIAAARPWLEALAPLLPPGTDLGNFAIKLKDLQLEIREATNALSAAVPTVGQTGKLGHAVMTVCNALSDARAQATNA